MGTIKGLAGLSWAVALLAGWAGWGCSDAAATEDPGKAPPPARVRAVAAERVAELADALRRGEATPDLHVRAVDGPRGGLVLLNRGRSLALEAHAEGVMLEIFGEHQVSLRPTRWGCRGQLRELGAAPAARASAPNRVEYRHDGVTEWYANSPLGLEQGFDVASPPCSQPEALEIELDVSGVDAVREGDAVALRSAGGETLATISDLYAVDAKGKAFAGEMAVHDGRLTLSVDVSGAEYPVTVDPLVATKVQEIAGGYGLELDGTTLATGWNFGSPGAKIYGETSGSWSLKQTLGASNEEVVSLGGDALLTADNGCRSYKHNGTSWGTVSGFGSQSCAAAAVSGDWAVEPYGGSVIPLKRSSSGHFSTYSPWLDGGLTNGQGNSCVAIDGETIAAAFLEAATQNGRLRVWAWSVNSWLLQSDISWPMVKTTVGFDRQGIVRLSGPTLLFWDLSSTAHVSERSGTTWSAPKPLSKGQKLDVDGDVAVVCGAGAGLTCQVHDRPSSGWSSTPAYTFTPAPQLSVRPSGRTAAVATNQGKIELWRINGATGTACGTLGECLGDRVCANGTCCTTACSAPCDVCSVAAGGSKDGTCSVAAKGTVPSPGCGGLACDGTTSACPASCTADSDCVAGKYCTSAGACADKKAQGAACSVATDCKNPAACGLCQSANCVDGFCCNSACGGSCDTCAQSLGASANGTCTVLGKGATPVPAGGCNGLLCGGGSATCPSSCSGNGDCITGNVCTGGVCVGPKPNGAACTTGNQCSSGFCADGFCCNLACTGQCEACDTGSAIGSCVPVVGKPHGTRTDCTGTALCKGACNGANPTTCVFPSLGTPCALASCTGDVLQPEGKCDGAGACSTPGTANCSPYGCDSSTNSCSKTCTSDAQCSQGAVCDTNTGKCAVGGATCADAYTLKQPNGQTQSCSPYKCVGGACQQQCAAESDCAPGWACVASACVAAEGGAGAGGGGGGGSGGGSGASGGASASGGTGGGAGSSSGGGSADEGGCGCRTHRRNRGAASAGWLAAGGLLWALRRRRRGRSRAA
ncbi:MAG: hypothetical protein HYZ29_35000 [Myxococcales bacterium]|nr:hypothetical protein [Myxococcales bacterium]